jgi:hypothetical protein
VKKKKYQPKYQIGDIVKFQKITGIIEHDLILGIGECLSEVVYSLLTLDSGKFDEDIYCDDYDKQSVKVA